MNHHFAKEYPHAQHITASLGRAINALQQLKPEQAVTDEAVRDAIEYFTRHHKRLEITSKHLLSLEQKAEIQTIIDNEKLAIKALKVYQPWISIKDRLPDDGYCLACCSTSHIRTTCFIRGMSQELVDLGYDVTHWMPLPQPPERRESDGEQDG